MSNLDTMDLGDTMMFIQDIVTAFPDGETFFVSEYVVSHEYGGPEEGGWWYDDWAYRRLVAVFGNEADANLYANDLTEAATQTKKENREQNRYSVIGTADYVYNVETKTRERETTERPHYC